MKSIKMSTHTLEEQESFFAPIVTRFLSLGKAFKTSTSYYFYDTGTGKVIQCSMTMYKILKCWESNQNFNAILDLPMLSLSEIANELDELRNMINDEKIMQAIPIEQFYVVDNVERYISGHVNMITLELTESCNLRCKYCIYQDFNASYRGYGNRNMSFETAKSAIDLLIKCSDELEEDKKLIVTFYGGEPLLQFDLIKQCVAYAESQDVSHEWLFSITTNCTLLSEEMIAFFAEKGFTLTASIDGDKEIHDANRVSPSGSGSFDLAIQNLKKLALAYKEHGVEGPHISINSVITPPYDFEKLNRIQNFFSSLEWLPNDARITWAYAQPDPKKSAEENEREIARTEIGDVMDLDPITEWHYENMPQADRPLFTREGEMRSLMCIQDRIISAAPSKIAPLNACCIPGSRRVYVTVDGKLKICERIGESPDIGCVEDGFDFAVIKRYFFDEYIEKSLPFCKDCWTVQMCALCYMYCFGKDGIDVNKKKLSCARIRFLNEQALIRYHDLLENNPDGLLKHLELSQTPAM